MGKSDIRWIQRFDNYTKAFTQLEKAVHLASERTLSELEEQGLIQAFEFTHELAWKTLKDFLNYQGNHEIYGSKDATRQAFKYELIEAGDIWMDMIKSRNNSSHTYNEVVAEEILTSVISDYYSEFKKLKDKLEQIKSKEII
ncbi:MULTISPECIES: nucleotidyltransferase substrate binding protein [unclassified Lentimicrobium]|uniref:nucleotidyltransferase substrate binding protein n=1 Tax=unclassified Lentimicrobium TaxID=2677434 RepID=UPI0015580C88|nr:MULTISPECIES: nucleotidyltransferase substrate binding protein [unclassified Lentimicrobium]NPD46149.1 nucleotidyltransferase [Lentimicrobium sp. S6]NPD86293.1 nucleotidyltransferase [Lentimicrobium sp. L6]